MSLRAGKEATEIILATSGHLVPCLWCSAQAGCHSKCQSMGERVLIFKDLLQLVRYGQITYKINVIPLFKDTASECTFMYRIKLFYAK